MVVSKKTRAAAKNMKRTNSHLSTDAPEKSAKEPQGRSNKRQKVEADALAVSKVSKSAAKETQAKKEAKVKTEAKKKGNVKANKSAKGTKRKSIEGAGKAIHWIPKRVHKGEEREVFERSKASGKAFVFGNGDCGQLGLGTDMIERKKPFMVGKGDEDRFGKEVIVDIASGGLHTIAITNEGKLWSWGCNDQRALGRGGEEYLPGKVEGVEDVEFVKVACGDSVTVGLTVDGKVYAWGTFRSAEGIMGYSENTKIQSVPLQIPELTNEKIVDISAGVDHVVALSAYGEVYCWGNGQQFQLGRRVLERRKKAGLVPERLKLKDIVKIGTGAYHSFAYSSDGVLYSWGLNNFNQCGLRTADGGNNEVIVEPTEVASLKGQKLVKMAGGEHHSLVMNDQGELFAFGRSDSSQTGLPPSEQNAQSNEDSSENKDGEELSVHKKSVKLPTKIPNIPKVIDFSCGSNHNLAITEDKKLYSWGYGEMLQCGNGEEEDVSTPTLVEGQKIDGLEILKISAGGQHSAIVVSTSS
ncbi:Protein pim1 [Zancudomyces culisetae]|uniref:Protein pim1 n=1 Tax=Zancudomyces culisetae TaxID=1213189 RepID=A0A1R1PG97_ZANCU|nr:Protein pim1 [Zancudomyces culisetae]OMH79958.1 Protein pim1 [Zancudomyces culisetae]|eukprot:OMH79684.1 Protein pim1 [Zancudomyces culisetae]